ncbi:MAG: TonB family protein [Blastocatellales bacterium]
MTTLVLALGVFTGLLWQDASLERRAVSSFQQVSVTKLDLNLPQRPLVSWFNQTVGSQAGVHWQITDCAGQSDAQSDPPICVEAVAVMPDERKAVLVATVGTYKNGVVGTPQLNFIVVEYNGDFYKVPRLGDLPGMLIKPLQPKPRPVELPAVNAKAYRLDFQPISNLLSNVNAVKMPKLKSDGQTQVPLPAMNKQKSEASALSLGETITKVTPAYPIGARQIGASGEVRVQVTVSEEGRVIQAKAISGHALLRSAAESAALKWVFKPVLDNGKPVQIQGVINFVFTRP